MSELSALLDKLSQLVRHLLVEVKNPPEVFSKHIFVTVVQGIAKALDQIDLICRAQEAKRCSDTTRSFIETISDYIVSKQKKVDEQMMLQRFLQKAKLYQDAFKELRAYAEKEEEEYRKTQVSMRQLAETLAPTFSTENDAIPVVDLGYVPKNIDLTAGIDSKFAKTKENLVRQQRQQQQAVKNVPGTGSQTVTDQVFDYLEEILDHNVLSDSTHQPTEEDIVVEVDLDTL